MARARELILFDAEKNLPRILRRKDLFNTYESELMAYLNYAPVSTCIAIFRYLVIFERLRANYFVENYIEKRLRKDNLNFCRRIC